MILEITLEAVRCKLEIEWLVPNVKETSIFSLKLVILALPKIIAELVTSENLPTNINFKFTKQYNLDDIRDNFTASANFLSLTGSGGTAIADGSGSNFIARNDEFTDITYGNSGSFIGPNTLLFRDSYAFGNVLNTISGSNIEYTDGDIWSGSVSASYFVLLL